MSYSRISRISLLLVPVLSLILNYAVGAKCRLSIEVESMSLTDFSVKERELGEASKVVGEFEVCDFLPLGESKFIYWTVLV